MATIHKPMGLFLTALVLFLAVFSVIVLNGEAKAGTVQATFTQDDDAKTVSFDYPGDLFAIHLTFEGEVIPTLLIADEDIIMAYDFVDGFTRLLISPEDITSSPTFTVTGGPFLSYTGSALMNNVDAADYDETVFLLKIENVGSELAIPFGFEIRVADTAAYGGGITIPVIKTSGSEIMHGFDMIIAYDIANLSVTSASPGTLFATPGDYEWESFSYHFAPFDCNSSCPSGLIRVVGIAETPDGPHHPNNVPIDDGAVLFNLNCQVIPDPELAGTFIPVDFFWIDCGDNGVAYELLDDPLGSVLLGVSNRIYDPFWHEISDSLYGFPGYFGVPDSCLGAGTNGPYRFINFTNGGVNVTSLESMELVLTVEDVEAKTGDTAIYLDVIISNPQDSIVGFELLVEISHHDLVEFGISPLDSMSIDISNTLTANWHSVSANLWQGSQRLLKIFGISDIGLPPTNAISPQEGGLLLRLIVHAADSVHPLYTDVTSALHIAGSPGNTGFADPAGNLIGYSEGAYNPATVSFIDGSITLTDIIRGDANGDGEVNIGDAVSLINYIFNGGAAPVLAINGDANHDGTVNIADVVYLINFIFNGGPAPCC